MPTVTDVPTGAPCWIDLQTSDVERARAVYGALLGWEAEEPNPDFGGYTNFTKDGVRVAGLMRSDAQAPVADVWSVYLRSDDVEKTLVRVVEHGGQVVVPAMPVGEMGVMGFGIDATGAAVGVWQPGTHRGFGVVGEPGAPSWFELHTRDWAGAQRFYRDAFGWQTRVLEDSPQFRYAQQVDGDEQLAGIMDASGYLPPEVPPHWAVYLGVEDCDAAVATLVGLGGSVIGEPDDSPYVRIAMVTDPMGAHFRLVAANEAMPAR